MPQVSALDDYLPCPAVLRWLPDRVADRTVRHVVTAGAPARLRRFAARWPEHTEGAQDTQVLIVAATLRRPLPSAVLRGVVPGTLIVELAAVGGLRIGERLFGLPARRSVRRLTGRRVSGWLAAGLADLEQWLTTAPPDTFVTTGKRRALLPDLGDAER